MASVLGSPALLCLLPSVQAVARSVVVYHVHSLGRGALPLNMNTADLHGDIFFDLRSAINPLECQPNETRGFRPDCQNPEVRGPELVVSKLNMTYWGEDGPYGRCNICSEAGIDPLSHLHCQPFEYFCTCGSFAEPYDCTDQRAVGVENISVALTKIVPQCSWAQWMDAPWTCWQIAVALKTGGLWYSTNRAGWCDAPDADPSTCTWRAAVLKIVNKSCSDEIIYDSLESYDAAYGSGCFAKCPPQQHPIPPAAKRDTSDPCWIYCYFETMLGREGVLPHRRLGGMPMKLVETAFEKPFAAVEDGGCPDLKEYHRGQDIVSQLAPWATRPAPAVQ